jgi:hypothetical protein
LTAKANKARHEKATVREGGSHDSTEFSISLGEIFDLAV